MSDDIERLKRLHELKISGAITEDEYAFQKSLILSAPQPANPPPPQTEAVLQHAFGSLAHLANAQDDSDLGSTWQTRFWAFDNFGRPKTLATNGGLSQLSMIYKVNVLFNFWAAIFGVFYLGYLGLWKRAIVVILIGISFDVLTSFSPAGENPFMASLFAALFAGLLANYGYYTKRRTGTESWRVWDSLR